MHPYKALELQPVAAAYNHIKQGSGYLFEREYLIYTTEHIIYVFVFW